MYQVVKRDGKIAEFDIQKICTAIMQAFTAQHHRAAGVEGDGGF